jgi:hypothetical protein
MIIIRTGSQDGQSNQNAVYNYLPLEVTGRTFVFATKEELYDGHSSILPVKNLPLKNSSKQKLLD